MDPVSIAANIVKVVCKIKDTHTTVVHNKRLCSTIQENVETIGEILSSADENTRIMSLCMRTPRPLGNLTKALAEARVLIEMVHEKSTVSLVLTADEISQNLYDANQIIIQSMQNVHFAMDALQPASPMDPYANSRKEHKEKYYSCSSNCSVSQLKAIVKELTEKNIIEQNGDYIMYKVTLRDGPSVVVHRIGRFGAATADAEHDIEVRHMAKLEHINILELLGYFSHEGFFYVVNAECFGILFNCIYDNHSKGNELSWQQWSDIILHIANGVVYLHDCGIIHMSLRPEIIGIGLDCVAKISCFHMSQILAQPTQEGVVTSLRMQRGFGPPEYEHYGSFSVKTDVYSYGVLLLELITGKMCILGDDNYNTLTASVLQYMIKQKMRKCIQPRLINAANDSQIEDIERCLYIALLCVEEDPDLRPTMHVVLGWLWNKKQVLPEIRKPAYITKHGVTDRYMDTTPMAMPTPMDLRSEKVDHYDSSRKEEKEEYYSCTSSCSESEMKAMIKDLSEENIIKQDGDYTKYKVTFRDGACIVHRIGRFCAARARAEHEIRVREAAKLEHINILELLGYFSHGGFLYMVYEKGFRVLSRCIYDNPSTGKELSWEWCLDIILDIADGVVYLHDRGCVHMYLHPTTITISHDCVAKISSFWISEILTESVQEGVATTFEMQWGYAPPEYERDGRFSVKTDVYSYGVLLLELITGQMCNQGSDNYNSLIVWVWEQTLENNMRQCIQRRLISTADGPEIEDIKRCIRIALLCVQGDPSVRPTMHDVRAWLLNKNQDLPRIPGDWRIKAR